MTHATFETRTLRRHVANPGLDLPRLCGTTRRTAPGANGDVDGDDGPIRRGLTARSIPLRGNNGPPPLRRGGLFLFL